MSTEKRLSSESPNAETSLKERLKTALAQEPLQVDTPITPEQRTVLEQELETMANLFEGYGKPWFVAGGTALDLAQGAWTRHHQDCDIAMLHKDVPGFFTYAQSQGYHFITDTGEVLENEQGLAKQPHNVFFFHEDIPQEHRRYQELMFLETDPEGNILFQEGATLSFSQELYTQSKGRHAQDGCEVPVTPKTVQLLHKLLDGRQKDLPDIERFLPNCTEEERAQLDGYIATLGVYFRVGNDTAHNVTGLLDLVHATSDDTEQRAIDRWLVVELPKKRERFHETLKQLFAMREGAADETTYLASVQQMVGPSTWERREGEIRKLADFLFEKPERPIFDEFSTFAEQAFSLDKILLSDAIREIRRQCPQQKRWETVWKTKP